MNFNAWFDAMLLGSDRGFLLRTLLNEHSSVVEILDGRVRAKKWRVPPHCDK